jgi:hypothetical protein
MPYKPQGALRTPPDDSTLWRYLDILKFLELIQTRSLWFSSAIRFEDILEGTWTDRHIETVETLFGKEEALRHREGARREGAAIYVSCWTKGAYESMAMWDLYGQKSGAIAIKTTVGGLRQALDSGENRTYINDVYSNEYYIGEVDYLEWNAFGQASHPETLCCRKNISYKHEEEVRALIFGRTWSDSQGPAIPVGCDPDPDKVRNGIAVQLDSLDFLTEIVVGPREQSRIERAINDLVRCYNVRAKVTLSPLLRDRSQSQIPPVT